MSETAELAASLRDMQTTVDKLRQERNDWQETASALIDYFVYGSGTSKSVQMYTQMQKTGRLSNG
jgi:hypothetical protein